MRVVGHIWIGLSGARILLGRRCSRMVGWFCAENLVKMMRVHLLALAAVLGAVALLAGCSEKEDAPCANCPEIDPAMKVAQQYVDSHQEELGLREGIDLMDPYSLDKDELGMNHVRFRQYYKGVRVEAGVSSKIDPCSRLLGRLIYSPDSAVQLLAAYTLL